MNTRRSRSHLSLAILRTSFAIFLASLIFLISCKHNSAAPAPVYQEPVDYRHSTLPLAVGNQWAYADTDYINLSIDPTKSAWLRLISIDSYTGTSDHGWWRCVEEMGIWGTNSFDYSIAYDTIYIQDYSNGAFLNPRIAFIPPSNQDTIKLPGPYNYSVTKVYALNHTLTTPAGTFDNIYVYEYAAFGKSVGYFCPSIGLISAEYYMPTDPYSSTYRLAYRTALIAYKITP